MITSDTSIYHQIVSPEIFKRLRFLWQQVAEFTDFQILLLTETMLSPERDFTQVTQNAEHFSILLSSELSALLLGKPNQDQTFYEITISFDQSTIEQFLVQCFSNNPNHSILQNALQILHHSSSNQTHLMNNLLLKIVKTLVPKRQENLDNNYPQVSIFQQIEQERLLNQVIAQIRQSLELPVVLETAVKKVRNFLQVDRLLIYQFVNETSLVKSQPRKGKIIYEARISESISSMLNLEAEDDCFSYIPQYQEKYRNGLVVAVEDVAQVYASSFCLAEFLRRHQVLSKLIAPIVVQDELWGLIIAHQCHQKRQWQEQEKKFLGQIGEHLAIAIYQAQLYAQVQQQKNLFEQRVIERTQELRDTLIAAEAANLFKSEFLSNISHELLTPLTCIIGLSSTLQRSSSTPDFLSAEKQQQYLKTIEDNGHKLQDLINDILNFSQLSAGQAILDIQEFSLKKLGNNVIQFVQNIAQKNQINLQLEIRFEKHESQFWADLERTQQILLHLLKNAIKFTPKNGIVTLRIWRESNQAVFQIEDTGIGIAEQQIPLLFETFKQLETSRKRIYGGIGLGLALTKQLVELHRGTIEVESTLNQGSLFTVRLPNQYFRRTQSSLSSPYNHQLDHQNKTVVLVENNEEIANIVCKLLIEENYQVIWLVDSTLSAKKIEIIQPSIVILDQQLPNAYQLSTTLKRSTKTSFIKILVLNDSSALSNRKFLQKNGIDDCLSKPIQATALLEKMKYLMSVKREVQELQKFRRKKAERKF